jgi:hypothetical protein
MRQRYSTTKILFAKHSKKGVTKFKGLLSPGKTTGKETRENWYSLYSYIMNTAVGTH